jgi:hypothetical protein
MDIEAKSPKEAKRKAIKEAPPWVDTNQPVEVFWLEKITRL